MSEHRECSAALLSAVAILVAFAANAQEATFSGVKRIVAVADIHGAHSAFVDILRRSDIVDEDLRWSADTTHLVIAGDVLDRGPDSKRALELIMRLESEASAAGGRVHMLLGNHEVMNLTGDLRYVSEGEYAAFADLESPAVRDSAYQRYRSHRHPEGDEADAQAAFDENYPRGYFAHRSSFEPAGELGSWLLEKPLIAVINGTAFVHGGLSQSVAGMDAATINEALGGQLRDYAHALQSLMKAGVLEPTDNFYDHPSLVDAYEQRVQSGEADWPNGSQATADRLRELFDGLVFLADGPLWYRGTVSCSPLIERDRLSGVLAGLGATRLVVGHTPTLGSRVQGRFDDSVFRIDTGMLTEYYGGRAAALVLDGRSASVIYADDGITRVVAQPRMLGTRPGSMSDDALETFLLEAEVSDRMAEDGQVILRLQRDGVELSAVFNRAQRPGVVPELAAYRLDRLLELGMVPVTVDRELDGVEGSLQFMPERVFTEAQRRENRLGAGAWCPLADQTEAMYLFDSLIFNSRSVDQILFNGTDLRVILIGHESAFTTNRGRPAYLEPLDLGLTTAWRTKLASLDTDLLTRELGDVLDRRRIRALLARRDELLEGN